MSKILTIAGKEFEFPIQGENPDWGSEVVDWAEAVTDSLETVQKPNDILPSIVAINNNQVTPLAILGFSFNSSEVKSINCKFYIERSVTGNSVRESGFIEGHYTGTDWEYSIRKQSSTGSGVTLQINSAGQVLYTSTNLAGVSYSGSIRFEARVVNNI